MELKQLRHFVAVIEEGGITAAARRLGITQPALSRQIQSLEEDLGVVLLDRGARSFSPTAAAEVLAADARKLLAFCDAMTGRVRATAKGLPLRIGYSPSLAGDFLSHAIERFSQIHPGLRISLQDASSIEMQQGLLAGKLDVIVTVPCGAGDAIRWIPLREYGWQLAMNARHPLAVERSIPVAALADAKLLLYDREHYPDYWQRVTAFFRDAKVQAKIAGEFDGITSLAAAIEANLGVAILADTTRVDPGRMVTRPMDVQPEPIPVAAGIPAGNPSGPHILEFIEELKQPLPLGS